MSHKLTIAKKGTRTQRLLFKKVGKAFDEKDMKVVMLETENEALKKRLWDQENKKKKVVISPNRKFAEIKDIMRSRGQLVAQDVFLLPHFQSPTLQPSYLSHQTPSPPS